MNNGTHSKPLVLIVAALVFFPGTTYAHQPRLVESRVTIVPEPEVSKAYYGTLTGEVDVYVINASEPFDLYVNVLVPDIEGQKKDVSAVVLKGDNQVALLDGANFDWKQFFEPFGADTYWMGPEYKARAEAGTYEVRVWSSNNDSKYSLAIGGIEAFDLKEGMNALTLVPQLKKDFFNESPAGFILSPMGFGFIIIMYVIAGIAGLALRFVMKALRRVRADVSSVVSKNASKNIGKYDRVARLAIAVGLLVWAITTSWSPIIIFFSGFALFEALFGWCGFYAVLGKNTCPAEM